MSLNAAPLPRCLAASRLVWRGRQEAKHVEQDFLFDLRELRRAGLAVLKVLLTLGPADCTNRIFKERALSQMGWSLGKCGNGLKVMCRLTARPLEY